MKKRWVMREPIGAPLREQFPELDPVVVQLLANRGITVEAEVEQFLNPDYEQDTHDPFLFADMQRSVDRIMQAIAEGEKITVHGDYDADGVCSSAIIVSTLRDLGGTVDVYIPHREKEGYGLNSNTVKYLHEQGTTLLITVDCGTANVEPVAQAEALGMNVIVTDHHHAPETLPPAFALINPQNHHDTYPFGYLCGAGVAFKVAQALYRHDQQQTTPRLSAGYDKWLLDLVAVATIADMMPLLDENRVLVKYGLVVLQKTRRIGLQKLMENAGIWNYGDRAITPFDIGFVIGPRLNAAGRMDHANAAYELLMAADEETAIELVKGIEQSNTDRRGLTEKIVEEVFAQIPEDIDERYLVFAYGTDWPIGLAGLVAGKVMQEIGKPVIVATRLEDRIAASGRSVVGFDMAQLLDEHRELFTTAGGHAMACGFSLEPDEGKLAAVREVFEAAAREALAGKDLRPELVIDAELESGQITWKLHELTQQLKPCGKENPEPIFVTRDLEVEEARVVGSDERHLKLRVRNPRTLKSFNAIAFGFGEYAPQLTPGTRIDLAYTVDVNEWNGNRELQLKIEDIEIQDKDSRLKVKI